MKWRHYLILWRQGSSRVMTSSIWWHTVELIRYSICVDNRHCAHTVSSIKKTDIMKNTGLLKRLLEKRSKNCSFEIDISFKVILKRLKCVIFKVFFKWANPGLFFVYFRCFQANNTFFTTNQCENVMSIQYTAPGFELTTQVVFVCGRRPKT